MLILILRKLSPKELQAHLDSMYDEDTKSDLKNVTPVEEPEESTEQEDLDSDSKE